MASPDLGSPWPFSTVESFDGSFNIHIEEGNSACGLSVIEVPTTSGCHSTRIPKPPPLPGKDYMRKKISKMPGECCCVPKETKDMWDKLFKEGFGADVHIITKEDAIIPAHSSVLVSKLCLALTSFECR